MTNEDTLFQETLADAVLDLPREFSINDKRYRLYAPSLGMSILIDRHMRELQLDNETFEKNPTYETLRLCSQYKEKMCAILAIFTIRDYRKISDTLFRQRREEELMALSAKELAKIFLFILQDVRIETLLDFYGLKQEQQKQSQIARYKNKKGNTISFGGKTIYGTLIDIACSRYGWSKRYVVWGIDLLSLRMLLADTINSVFLSDEEKKELRINPSDGEKVGMTQDEIDRIKSKYDWS